MKKKKTILKTKFNKIKNPMMIWKNLLDNGKKILTN